MIGVFSRDEDVPTSVTSLRHACLNFDEHMLRMTPYIFQLTGSANIGFYFVYLYSLVRLSLNG